MSKYEDDNMLKKLSSLCDVDDFSKEADEDEGLMSDTSDNADTDAFRALAMEFGIISEASEDEDGDGEADESGDESTVVDQIDDEQDDFYSEAGEMDEGMIKIAYEAVDTKMAQLGITPFDYANAILQNEHLAGIVAENAEKLAAVQDMPFSKVADDMIDAIVSIVNMSDDEE